jgi:GNAT superfamily N-acetyltransferase
MIIRPAREEDVPVLVELCAEHALYERASYEREGKVAKLHALLFSDARQLWAWVAEENGALVGYATATLEVATWTAEAFMHMDCVFVRQSHRNQRLGARLMREVALEAKRLAVREMQWQTPLWNSDADRFYRRLPVIATEKYRYTFQLGNIPESEE